MNALGNIIWFVFGGVILSLMYLISGLLLCITIVGIPFGIQIIKLSALALWPFDRTIGLKEYSTGFLSVLMNVIWILLGGFWIGVTHLVFALLFYITIIGIPFGRQHMKLAGLAVAPFGRRITLKRP